MKYCWVITKWLDEIRSIGCSPDCSYNVCFFTQWILSSKVRNHKLPYSKNISGRDRQTKRKGNIIVRRACRTYLIATRFWVVVICPIIKCLTVLEFSFISFDLCLFITIFNFILNYVPIVTFWIFTYHKIWILLIIFYFIWNYWIIYFLTCLEVFRSVVSYLVSVCCGLG